MAQLEPGLPSELAHPRVHILWHDQSIKYDQSIYVLGFTSASAQVFP